MSYTKTGVIDKDIVLEEKRSLLRDYGLTLFTPDPDAKVGGLRNSTTWRLRGTPCCRRQSPSASSPLASVCWPPGTGRVAGCQAICEQDPVAPIILLGATDIRKKYVGQGEAMLKTAIDVGSSMGAIIFIDEIDKFFMSATSNERWWRRRQQFVPPVSFAHRNPGEHLRHPVRFHGEPFQLLPEEFIDRADVKFAFGLPEKMSDVKSGLSHLTNIKRFNPQTKQMEYRDPDNYPLDSLVKHSDGPTVGRLPRPWSKRSAFRGTATKASRNSMISDRPRAARPATPPQRRS